MASPTLLNEYKAGWAAAIAHAMRYARPTLRDYGDHGATAPDIDWSTVSTQPVSRCTGCVGVGMIFGPDMRSMASDSSANL